MLILSCASLLGNTQTETQIKSRKIKVVQTSTSELKDGVAVRRIERETFDKKGNLIERKTFSADSVCIGWKQFQYDRRGNLLLEATLHPTSGATKSSKQIQYNKFDDEVLMVLKNENGSVEEETETQYDKDRRRVSVIKRDGQKNMISTTTFKYDQKGMLISRITVNAKAEVIVERTISYTY